MAPQRAGGELMRPVVVVTGASSGIGAELARLFAAAGRQVVMVARRSAEMETLADQFLAHGLLRPIVLSIDLARLDGPSALAHQLAARFLEPEVVVNAAGFGLYGAAHELDRSEQAAMIDVNVRALTDLTLRFVPSLIRHRGGVLNVASVGGFVPGPRMATYYASKAYVVSLGEALHQEWAALGIRVTTLCPGPVKTGFQARAGFALDRMPAAALLSASDVALAGYDGFRAGKALVVPGFLNKLAVALPRLLPRRMMASLVARGMANRGARRKPF